MRVKELADDLKVRPDVLVRFLQKSGVRVGNPEAPLADGDVAKVRTRLERERIAAETGNGSQFSASDFMRTVVRAAKPASCRRRRRTAAPKAKAPTPTAAPEPPAEPAEAPAGPVAADEPAAAKPEEATATPAPDADRVEHPAPAPEPEPPSIAAAPDAAPPSPTAPPEAAPDSATPAAPSRSPAPAAARPDASASRPKPARDGAPAKADAAGAALQPAASAGPGGTVRIQAEGYTSDGRRKQKRKKGRRRAGTSRHAAQENVQRVLAELKGGRRKGRKGKTAVAAAKEDRAAAEEQAAEARAAAARTVRVNEFLTVSELADLVDVAPNEIIGSAFKNMGFMVTINQRLDFDQIELLLEGFGFTAVRETDYQPAPDVVEEEDDEADLRPRPAVVTVMGHVDHGKTLLLDWIRKTNVVAGEAGGITQHIGAYHVDLDDGRTITFLDTPGHAAFTAMRARGADVTDLVVLVVAADDAVMPQTVEAVSHARNAGVPLVVAVNKIDLPAADSERVKRDLLQHDVTVEDFGGETLVAEISAKTGQGMDDLLDKILLQAELLELTANPSRQAAGTVVEAELDPGMGPVATILVRNGTLRVGDSFVAGLHGGRVRALLDERGNKVDSAGPGIPVQLLGCSGVPKAGDVFQAMDAIQAADVAVRRQRLDREKQLRIKERGIKLGDFSQLAAAGQTGVLRLVIKGDVDGSVQALADSLERLATDEVKVDIVHRGVGAVNESDVMLALTAGAAVLGFRVRPDGGARQAAGRENVDVRIYDVIYEAVDDVTAALEGLLAPERRENVLGAAEARVVFKIKGVGTIAGSYVTEGVVQRGAKARIVRDGVVVYQADVSSLKRFKDDAKEVKEGFECGIGIANFNDVKVGDVIETYQVEEVARTLDTAGTG